MVCFWKMVMCRRAAGSRMSMTTTVVDEVFLESLGFTTFICMLSDQSTVYPIPLYNQTDPPVIAFLVYDFAG